MQGPAGPTGSIGSTGPTGPESGTTLIEAAWVTGGLSTLASGAVVPFDNIREAKGDIFYTPGSGVFTVGEPGYYLVNWWVATAGASPAVNVNFDLLLNGIIRSQASSPNLTGQVVGTALIRVSGVPSTISLINDTGAAVTIPQTPFQADITITRVSSLP